MSAKSEKGALYGLLTEFDSPSLLMAAVEMNAFKDEYQPQVKKNARAFAKALTENGLKTLMLDRGRMVRHRVDYPTDGKPAFELPYRGEWPPDVDPADYPLGVYVLPKRLDEKVARLHLDHLGVVVAVVGDDAGLGAGQGQRVQAALMQGHAQQRHGDALACGKEHIHFTSGRLGGKFPCHRQKIVGGFPHG